VAQLVVRNLPDHVKERLRRRAKRHGRSLEAEVRDILAQVPEPTELPEMQKEGLGTFLARRMKEIGVTNGDVGALEENIAELRRAWRLRKFDLGE
jgi:plasmid stability protein